MTFQKENEIEFGSMALKRQFLPVGGGGATEGYFGGENAPKNETFSKG